MTAYDLKIINLNYYTGDFFKVKLFFHFNNIFCNICYWLKIGMMIFYFFNIKDILSNKFNINEYNLLLINNIINIKLDSLYYRYVFCGHSLSGTIASLVLYNTIISNINYLYLYNLITYGALSIRNKKIKNVILKYSDIYRYVNNNDIIAAKPREYKYNKPIILLNQNIDSHSLLLYIKYFRYNKELQ